MGIHDEHRQRVLKKFDENGFEGLEEHEKLEIILYFSVPRVDTNPIAHELINKYHTVSRVMEAPETELIEFKHITHRTVQLFKMIKETARFCQEQKLKEKSFLATPEEVAMYCQQYFTTVNEEQLIMICLDRKGKFLDRKILSKGDFTSVEVSTRRIIEIAIATKASEIVLSHNHPGGLALPSSEDIAATKQVVSALANIGVKLTDHIIVGSGDTFSFASNDGFSALFK